jgi:hypothetical protein
MMDDAYLTTKTGAAGDGKVKVELGDDPTKSGTYTYSFTLYNLENDNLNFELSSDFFTQAAYGSGDESIQGQIRDFFDKLLSRIIGAIVRIMILIAGIVWLVFEIVASLALIILWPVMPLLPVACVVLTVMGVTL